MIVKHVLDAKVWFRESTNEWVLEIDGVIDGGHVTARHTQPAWVKLHDVPRLPTLYDSEGDEND